MSDKIYFSNEGEADMFKTLRTFLGVAIAAPLVALAPVAQAAEDGPQTVKIALLDMSSISDPGMGPSWSAGDAGPGRGTRMGPGMGSGPGRGPGMGSANGFAEPGAPLTMPPKGGNSILTDQEIKDVHAYMHRRFGCG